MTRNGLSNLGSLHTKISFINLKHKQANFLSNLMPQKSIKHLYKSIIKAISHCQI
ncbi:hypothetical protein UNSW2_401 [Campylobacter concisus UNSW2]|uniref:Uncharacterized protein n=1 Tax=Campylobacter concisus UNSW2 TaxID=1242965 RepID=U2H1K5_9BACT|nr:hypothetical protein UNSW2_401 [Campylobacter concisus UNSW2]